MEAAVQLRLKPLEAAVPAGGAVVQLLPLSVGNEDTADGGVEQEEDLDGGEAEEDGFIYTTVTTDEGPAEGQFDQALHSNDEAVAEPLFGPVVAGRRRSASDTHVRHRSFTWCVLRTMA